MRIKISIVLLSILVFAGCRQHVEVSETVNAQTSAPPIQENAIQAVLWQQRSAEYAALCYQAYNVARMELDKMLKENPTGGKKPAIITDLDETVMDNSPFQGKMVEENQNYSKQSWIEWGEKRSAKPVPGSVDFFKYAASKGVEIFYVSNRYPEQVKASLDNLKEFGLPFVDEAHLMLRSTSSSKSDRRKKIEADFDVLMLIGDNLSDFSDLFEHQNATRRHFLTDSLQQAFGQRFIVLPNTLYGDWLNNIYDGKHDWSEAQKDSIRRSKIHTW